jgi:glutathione S-transferase
MAERNGGIPRSGTGALASGPTKKEDSMLTIYGNPMSTCTRKVLMTLAETQTPYEMVVIDFGKGEHKQAPHLRRQPFGRVPALEDGDFAMFESRAMCRYLNRKAGGSLVPAELKAMARVEQWISIETSEFSSHAMKFVYHHVFRRPQEPAVLEAAGKALETTCALMDRQLAQTPFVAGEAFTLADICFMPYLEYLMSSPARDNFGRYASLVEWWNRIGERPAWRKVVGKA